MTENQKKVTAWIGILVLTLAVAAVCWLAWSAAADALLDESDQDQAKLKFGWQTAAWFMRNGAIINTAFATVLLIISTSVQVVSKSYQKTLQIVSISILCILGILACIWLLVEMDNPDKINALRYYGHFTEASADVESKLRAFLLPLMGWFATFLAAELGIGATAKSGAIRSIFVKE